MNNLKYFFKSPIYLNSFLLFLFFILNFSTIYSQKRKDSLISLIIKKENSPNFSKKDTSYINTLQKLAFEYEFSTSDTLLTFSKKALEYSTSINYEKGKSLAYFGISAYYLEKGKDSLVLNYLNKSKQIATKNRDTVLLLRISNYSAIQYDHIGDSAKSLKEYLESEKLALKYNNKVILLTIYENIGVTYSHKKLYDKAIFYYKKAKKIALEINDEMGIGTSSCNLTRAYIGTNNLELAKKNIDLGIKTVTELELEDWVGYAYKLKGDINLKEEKYDDALSWYKKSETIQLKTNYDIGKMDLFNCIAKVYVKKNEIHLAKDYAIKACKLAKEIKYPRGISDASETLSSIYEKLNDPSNALKYHHLFKKMSDSVSKSEQLISITFIDIENKHKEEQEALINSNNLEVSKQRKILYFFLITIFILAIIGTLIIRNLNTQKKLSEALKIKNETLVFSEKELMKNNLTKDKLFSIIGHDLRGPILSLKQLLQETEDEKVIKRFIPKLKNDVEHIHFTLNNLLIWGKTQMKGFKIFQKQINLHTIASNNIKLFTDIIEKKELNILLQIPDNSYAFADEDHIDLILRNILNNAIKFTPKGGVITISSKQNNNRIETTVADTGKGISKNDIHKIFNDNEHFSTYGTNNEKGTGLGLSLCKEMIELNKGEIWVKSEENIGSSFTFTLPTSKSI